MFPGADRVGYPPEDVSVSDPAPETFRSVSYTHLVYTDTVGQYAGIDDKNDTKVFEGDILKLKRHLYVVEWKGGCLYASQKNYLKDGASGYYKLIDSLMNEGAEIIGNIHDNPELLEEYAK